MPGIDAKQGLSYTNNNQDLYLDLLIRFKRSNQDASDQLRSAWKDGDQVGLRRLAHTIKSTARMLGANAVSKAASRLEMNQDAPQRTGELIDELHAELGLVLHGLAGLEQEFHNGACPAGGDSAVDLEAITPVMRDLAGCLDSDMKQALRLLGDLGKLLQTTSLGGEYQALKQDMDDFENENVLKRLEAMAQKLEIELT